VTITSIDWFADHCPPGQAAIADGITRRAWCPKPGPAIGEGPVGVADEAEFCCRASHTPANELMLMVVDAAGDVHRRRADVRPRPRNHVQLNLGIPARRCR